MRIHQLDSVIVVLYRPPDTTASELKGALSCLDETLSSLQAPMPSVVLCGDLNLGSSAVKWRRSVDGDLVPVIAGHREGETSGAMQASLLLDLCHKYGLVQQVEGVTRQVSGELLDLVFSSDENLISHVELEDHLAFTDHAIVTCYTTYKSGGQKAVHERSYLCDTGRRYGKLDFHNASWTEIKQELNNLNWSDMMTVAKHDPATALEQFHDKVLIVLETLVPARKDKSKYRMPRKRKQLWTRISKVTERLGKATSVRSMTKLLKEKDLLDKKLKQSYSGANLKSDLQN